jgi:WD40 repeat protein
MMYARLFLLGSLVLFVTAPALRAQQTPSYAKQVRPFFARYCLECHNATDAKSDLNLESFSSLQRGGKNGPVVVPGKPDVSRLVLLPESKQKPKMPPRKAKQPNPGEVEVLRAWVAAGARDDTGRIAVAIPVIKPRVPRPAPITALAYRPDGKLLVVGSHKEAPLLDASGDLIGTLPDQPGKVTGLAFSRDGRRLAVAASTPATGGVVRLYTFPSEGPTATLERTLAAHRDAILDLAFGPDGKLLATTGYDRLIKLWDVTTGAALRTLKDHSDAVYGLAFSPDGWLLASAAADRAVKVWDVATGKRLYTLSESTDWVYAVAWSPDGRHLAAAGVDRSIRVWEVSAAGGRLVQSIFAHAAPITRLAYSPDGQTLYSLSEDRTVKAWETARMVERRVYAPQPEAVLALALRSDQKQLALGRYDGAVVFVEEATGKVHSQPLPAKPKPPQIAKLSPGSGQRGRTVRVTFEGKHLDQATQVIANYPGATAKLVAEGNSATTVSADITFPANTPAGPYKLALKSPAGTSAELPFIVDLFPLIPETEPNDSPTTGQKIALPATVAGAINRPGSVDFYRFEATAGDQVGVQVLTDAVGSKLAPVLQLTEPTGRAVAESTNGLLGYTCSQPGIYALGIRDQEYRGGEQMHYRLHIGPIPVVTAVFPLGLQRGTEAEIHLEGVNLGDVHSVRIKAPADAAIGTWLPVPISTPAGKPLGKPKVVVGKFPESFPGPEGLCVPVSGTANSFIDHPGATNTWRFSARKGQRLIVEVNAHRLGSPLDSVIEILNAQGQPMPRATLRCVAKTYVTFRDHDSVLPGIRLESWNEFAMNDYVWVGNQLLRILELPRGPDDDCQFFGVDKQRVGFLDTTPIAIPFGSPMYKVSIHPPGTTFPPNGFPVINLTYRNDDGGPGYGKDSRLFFDPPADGDYQVRIGDARGQGGSQYAYRLTIRSPRPSFTIKFGPKAPSVWKGTALPVTISAERFDGFEGPIEVRLENVPAGLSAPATTVPAGEYSTTLALWANPDAKVPAKTPPLKLVARAHIDGKDVVREVTGGVPRVVDPGELGTTTAQQEVVVRPGQEVWLTAHIERRNGFKSRVPLEVRGLPHGVYVLNVGLNGILITEQENSRRFAIYAEPWVQPTTHPFVVLARNEGKGTEFAAKSVLLKVAKP